MERPREEIMLALRLCTETPATEDCLEKCPYYRTDQCIKNLLNDTFEMVKETIRWKEIDHGTDDRSLR